MAKCCCILTTVILSYQKKNHLDRSLERRIRDIERWHIKPSTFFCLTPWAPIKPPIEIAYLLFYDITHHALWCFTAYIVRSSYYHDYYHVYRVRFRNKFAAYCVQLHSRFSHNTIFIHEFLHDATNQFLHMAYVVCVSFVSRILWWCWVPIHITLTHTSIYNIW